MCSLRKPLIFTAGINVQILKLLPCMDTATSMDEDSETNAKISGTRNPRKNRLPQYLVKPIYVSDRYATVKTNIPLSNT